MAETKKSNPDVGGATVNVASKMPFDFTLRLHDFKERYEPVMGGGQRKYKIAEARFGAPEFIIKGNSVPARGHYNRDISSGYAITRDIPKDFWDEWLVQNSQASYVVNKIIFAQDQYASVISMAKDHEHIKSGMEALDRNNLPKSIQNSETRRAA